MGERRVKLTPFGASKYRYVFTDYSLYNLIFNQIHEKNEKRRVDIYYFHSVLLYPEGVVVLLLKKCLLKEAINT